MDLVTLAVAQKYTRDKIAEAAVGGVDVTELVTEKVAEVVGTATEPFNTLGEMETAIKNKVDKVDGKGLSTNDFTNAEKTKLASALTSYTETDPTVPAWAKAENKPTYTASEVGAVPATRMVNGKSLSGNITLSATDVKALPDTTTIPTTLAGLSDDTTHRVVTDTEKAAWNAGRETGHRRCKMPHPAPAAAGAGNSPWGRRPDSRGCRKSRRYAPETGAAGCRSPRKYRNCP
jgi:hypothetical protein